MPEEKRGMHCPGVSGDMCDICLGGKHHGMARVLLTFAIVVFVFFVGIAIGEMKGYMHELRSGGDSYDYSWGPGMMAPGNTGYYRMMRVPVGYDTTTSPSPAPLKK